MISKHVFGLNTSASGQLRELVKYLGRVIPSKEIVVKVTVKRAEVVPVALPKFHESLRSVVDQDAVSVRRPSERSFRTRVVFDKE